MLRIALLFILIFTLHQKSNSQSIIQAVKESNFFEKKRSSDCKPKTTYSERKKSYKPKKKKKSAFRKKKSKKSANRSRGRYKAFVRVRNLYFANVMPKDLWRTSKKERVI